MTSPLSVFVRANRTEAVLITALLVGAVAVMDMLTEPYLSINFLYLFPIMMAATVLSRARTVGVALLCTLLGQRFGGLPADHVVAQFLITSAGFVGTGLVVVELFRDRRVVLQHAGDEVHAAQEQVAILVENSPAAIVILDRAGTILVANDPARHLLAPNSLDLSDRNIGDYVPFLATAAAAAPSHGLRTGMQCAGRRDNGEAFLGSIWFSSDVTPSGPRLTAIILDLSDDLRSREDLSLDHVAKHARIVQSAMAHEMRNLSSAAQVIQKNLSRSPALEDSDDFRALGTVIEGLARIATLEPGPFGAESAGVVDLMSALDEVRVLIEAAFRESAIALEWRMPERLPKVWADRYGLVQVFLNLARNSRSAMQATSCKRVSVTAVEEQTAIVIRFTDSGPGVSAPDRLFRPFQSGNATGLGLYISRAVMRGCGGDLVYEPTDTGCSFAVLVPTLSGRDRPAG